MSTSTPPEIPGLVYVQPVGSGGYADVFLYEQQMPRMNVAVKVLKGDLDANAAFMQGKMKVAGNMGKLMSLMPLTQSADYKAIQTKVADQTDY